MRKPAIALGVGALLVLSSPSSFAQVVAETWDWVSQCRKIAPSFKGTPGVVCHLGDSITYCNGYSQWARHGRGQTPSDKAILKWMHVQSRGPDAPTSDPKDFPAILKVWANDGFWLAYTDRPDGGSYTAQSGIRTDQYLNGTKNLPPLEAILDAYNPHIVVIMLGTNDASANRPATQVAADLDAIIAHVLWDEGKPAKTFRGTIPILSTIPPKKDDMEDVQAYNTAIAGLAKKHNLPLIDYCGEILSRRPGDWLGTLISEDGIHPTANDAAADPYVNGGENLKKSGLLLRCFLTVQKVKEVAVKALGLTLPGN